ncbi:methylthioribulose 1-phosphate dehydratase [Crossiella sp. CA-258035]|uniref:methylthioribulose 1-phosphate dehydratase n=1 Tax=Crossiella sp. CA-258035 TaxID=2981138 RepID=UPI0024BD1157|nr:methylthioribulose 1-phosphate dehydratase [Crossiella sp. CA-258035]WHT20917.1 methylthioribulose 1-phosphate dehydratase [Crossiella sp. CA-258035]
MSAGATLAAAARELYQRGWLPGTAGNISVRVSPETALITASGRDKGALTESDTVLVSVDTSAAVSPDAPRPSAETTIHTAIYRATKAEAVVHTHSPYATAVATLEGHRTELSTVDIQDFELLKGLGLRDPSATTVPVFPNHADVPRIAAEVERYLIEHPDAPPVVLIEHHGLTTWGADYAQARNRMECVESICQLLLLLKGRAFS